MFGQKKYYKNLEKAVMKALKFERKGKYSKFSLKNCTPISGETIYKLKVGREEYTFSPRNKRTRYLVPYFEKLAQDLEALNDARAKVGALGIEAKIAPGIIGEEKEIVDALECSTERVRETRIIEEPIKDELDMKSKEAGETIFEGYEDPSKCKKKNKYSFPNFNAKNKQRDWEKIKLKI